MATFLPPWRWPHSCHPEDGHILSALKMATFLPPWIWPHSWHPKDDHILAAKKMATFLPPWRWPHTCHPTDGHMSGRNVLVVTTKKNSHSYTQVHYWMISCRSIVHSKVSFIWPNTTTAIQYILSWYTRSYSKCICWFFSKTANFQFISCRRPFDPARSDKFLFSQNIQTGSGSNPASRTMRTGDVPGGNHLASWRGQGQILILL